MGTESTSVRSVATVGVPSMQSLSVPARFKSPFFGSHEIQNTCLLISFEVVPQIQQLNQIIGQWDPRQVPQSRIGGFAPVFTVRVRHLWGVLTKVFRANTLEQQAPRHSAEELFLSPH